MMNKMALLALVALLAVLPPVSHALGTAGCNGGYPDGNCEIGESCDCSDCWGLNPPESGGATFCDASKFQVCLPEDGKPPGDTSAAHKCRAPPAWYQPEVERVAGNWQVWGPISALAVLIAMLVVALAYMLGIGFDLPELRMWAKSELYQALASAVLVAGLVMLVAVMTDEGIAKILGQAINPFSMAYGYLLPLAEQLKSLYAWNYGINFPVEAFSSLDLYSNATLTDIYFLFFLKPTIVEPLHLANHYVIQVLLTIYFQVAILNFFQQAALGTLLPLGVFLRIFPFTRGTGGLLIAMAIGFFLVYPTIFGFITLMTEDENALRASMAGDTSSTLGVDVATYNACDHNLEAAAGEAEKQTDPAILSKINERYSFLPPLILKILFYPIVVFAVTFTFIKVASPLLGADISEVGQGLVKLL